MLLAWQCELSHSKRSRTMQAASAQSPVQLACMRIVDRVAVIARKQSLALLGTERYCTANAVAQSRRPQRNQQHGRHTCDLLVEGLSLQESSPHKIATFKAIAQQGIEASCPVMRGFQFCRMSRLKAAFARIEHA